MTSPDPQVDCDYSITDEDVIPLVCSLIGVSETVMKNVIKNIENPSKKPPKLRILGKKTPKKSMTKNTSFDCLVIKNLINIESENGPEQIPSLDQYQTKLKEKISNDFSRDQIKNWLNIIGLKWTDESIQKSEEIYSEENTKSQTSSEDVKIRETTEEYSLENIKLGEPEIEIKTEIEEENIENPSKKPQELPILSKKTPKKLMTKNTFYDCLVIKTLINIESENGPEQILSLDQYQTKLNEKLCNEFTRDQMKNLLNIIGLKWTDDSIQKSEEIYTEENTESQTSSEDVKMRETTEEYSLDNIKLEEAEIEIKSEIEENFIEESSSELTDEIQTESALNYNEPVIWQDFTDDIKVELKADTEFNEIRIKNEFCDVEDSLQPHVILRNNADKFVEDLTSELEDEIEPENPTEVLTECEFSDAQSVILQKDIEDVKIEEEFNEIHMKTEYIDDKSNNEFTCAEEEVQLEFVDVEDLDESANNLQTADSDSDKYVGETGSDLPTLDYFVDKLSLRYSNYPKSFVAKWLKRLEIGFQEDDKMDTTVKHLANNLKTQTDYFRDSIDPRIEEIITDICISCQKQGIVPSLSMFVSNVQSYDKNIDADTLEELLKKLKIIYRHDLPILRKRKKPFGKKDQIPFEYFYNHINLTRHKCTKNTLKKWLELLKINFVWNNSDPELKCRKTKDKISPPVVKILLSLEKNFGNQQQWKSRRKNVEKRTPETRDVVKDCQNVKTIPPPTLDFFYSKIKVCCKPTLIKWLSFLNIKFGLDNYCDMGSECKKRYLLPDSSTIKRIEQLNTYFYRPKEAEHEVLLPIVDELFSHFKGKGEILTLDFIYNYIISSKAFDSNLTCSKRILRGWLKERRIRFRDDNYGISEKRPSFFYDRLQLPTLDYFYKNINENRYVCCKSILKKWLDCLTIKYESEEIIEPKQTRELRLSSTAIINRLIKLEEKFNKNKILSLMLIESLTGIANEHKSRGKIPTLDGFHQYVVNSKLFKANQGYNKESLTWVLNRLNINYKTSERDELGIPTLGYFYEKLQSRGVPNLTYTMIKIGLIKAGIQFENNLKLQLDENVDIKNLSHDITSLLHEIDTEYRVKNLITLLKNRDKNIASRKWKPPTFTNILNIIDKYDLFDADINAGYKKTVLKKWVQKLGIKFLDEEEKDPQDLVPPLDYFYKKLTQIEGNVYTKDTLAYWLCQIGIQFKEQDSTILKTNKPNNVPSRVINTLCTLSKFYRLSDVEPTFKNIFEEFTSRNQTPSIEFLQKKLFELKGFHSKKGDLKQWFDYIGIKFQNKRCRDQIENEIDKKVKKKCKSLLLDTKEDCAEILILEEPKPKPQILEIDDSSSDSSINSESDMSFVEESKPKSKTQIIEIEEDSMDSNIEATHLTQHTEVIQIEDDDDITVNEQYVENMLDTQPSTSNNQQKSIPINAPLLLLEPNQNIPVLLVLETQQPELQQKLKPKPNEPPKSLQKSSKKLRSKSKPDKSPKSIQKNLSAPDEVMKLLTDVEYDFYKLKKTPALNHFYDSLVKTFGRLYSKEMLEGWLKKAGIRFKVLESFEYMF